MKNKKYVVYEKLNKIGGGKTFDSAKDACKYAKEILADYGFTMFKDNGETWKMSLMQNLFLLERAR